MRAVKTFMLGLLALFAVAAAPAMAAEWQAYTPQAFAAAQASGKPIVVHVHAVWCPTCKAQTPTLDELRQDAALADAVFMRVDFDAQKDFLRAHRVASQSTILIFRGEKEVARSVAETDRGRLRDLVLKNARG
jgi:thiol:disulfide interchange protein